MSRGASWDIEWRADGTGRIAHRAAPRFEAHWITGEDPEALAAMEGPCWIAEGSGESDTLVLYAFRWADSVPDTATFERLAQAGALAIDAWIAARL